MKRMKHNNRKFDLKSYNDNDERAKQAIITYLHKNNYLNIEDKEDFYFDVIASKENKFTFFEVEIKNQWWNNWNTAWKEIRIPERKRRLIQKWRNEFPNYNLTFVIFNTNCSKAWFIDGDTVAQAPVGTIQNSKRIGAPHLKEPFFHIPIEQASLTIIKEM